MGTAAKDRRKRENAFYLFTISVSEGPAFAHGAVRVAGSHQTVIVPRPKAAAFQQGHSSSHGKGNGLWPWSLITSLLQPSRSAGKPREQTNPRSDTQSWTTGGEVQDGQADMRRKEDFLYLQVKLEQRLQLRVTVHVTGSPIKGEARNWQRYGGELLWKAWLKRTQEED